MKIKERDALLKSLKDAYNYDNDDDICLTPEEILGIIHLLEEQPPSDTVSRGVFEQVMWERDVALEQLKELGYELGQKTEPCDDAISRADMLDAVGHGTTYTSEEVQIIVNNLPPVTSQQTGKMLICPSCGLDVHSDFAYCPRCGAKIQESEDKECEY